MKLAIRVSIVALCSGLLGQTVPAAAASKWMPVDPADRALKAGVVEKDADAEALFWDVRVSDQLVGDEPETVLEHYVRIKIFTTRGRDAQSTVDLVHVQGVDIKEPRVQLNTPFGEFTWSCSVSSERVVITRTLRLKNMTIEPEEYEAVREFVQKVRAADDAAFVLAPI